MSPTTRLLPLLVTGLVLVATRPTNGERPLVVRADPVLASVLDGAVRSYDGAVVMELGPLRLDEAADVVAGEGPVMTRLLEEGRADLSREVLLPPIRWVLVGRNAGKTPLTEVPSVRVPSGDVGGSARRALARLGVRQMRTIEPYDDPDELALVPESLAGDKPYVPVDVEPLLMSIAPMATSSRRVEAERFVAHVRKTVGARELTRDVEERSQAMASCTGTLASPNAVAVADWWVPQESLALNRLNDPQLAVGVRNASGGSIADFAGFVSLGSAGYVTLDMGGCIPDGPGADIRVFQYVSTEQVTVYASSSPSGPFSLIGYRVKCSAKCDFDLADAATPIAGNVRYLKVEDGELFASNGGGGTNGADLDAVTLLSVTP